jgi:hypothetical protein
VSERSQARPEPWLIHFFQRDARDDKAQRVPAIDFLDQVPTKVRAEMQAVLEAVAEAPPPAFSGGGKWEVMHDDMAGFYEVRVRGAGRRNHRLFCILERGAADLGGSSVVVIDGLSKPVRQAADPREYRRAQRYRAEFLKRRTVLQ